MRRDKAIKYMRVARFAAAEFSKDPSTKVGAILLAPESLQVLSLGYNGMPRGIDEADPSRWERPTKYAFVEHAERNCLYNACRLGTPIQGAICVVTLFPCVECTRALIQSGVATIVAPEPESPDPRWAESWKLARAMMEESGTTLMTLTSAEIDGA